MNIAVHRKQREESLEQVDAKLIKFMRVQSQSECRDGERTAIYDQQAKPTAELALLCTQSVNETTKMMESASIVT